MQTNIKWEKRDQWLPRDRVGSGYKEPFGGDGFVCYLGCGDGLTAVYIY